MRGVIVDSIPAFVASTNDPSLVYTMNVFAIPGLRSLCVVLSGVAHSFRYVKHGMWVVLRIPHVAVNTEALRAPRLADVRVGFRTISTKAVDV